MNKILCLALFFMLFVIISPASYKDKAWKNICTGTMGDEWYGSAEAISVADILISVQKTNGGWMKNDEFHKLTSDELKARQATSGNDGRNIHSCFDNGATTQEMRFLAKVYQKTKESRFQAAFQKALNLIFEAGSNHSGGWPQYWPLNSDQYSYQNYITFNDDLMTRMMKLLQEINEEKGDFAGIVDANTRAKCKTQWDKALECVLKCQIDDNGVKAAWCAQHDPKDFMPVEGRPQEMPGVSGSESANLLAYLMTIPNPSKQLKECIITAVTWLKNHIYKENAVVEKYTNSKGEEDRRIVSKSGSNLWGRFIQVGGQSGQAIYQKFYNKKKAQGNKRKHHSTGYVYKENEIIEASYDKTKDYQPIYGIYSNDFPELFHRYLYNYEDTPDAKDKYGQMVATSLKSTFRCKYQFLGNWPDSVIKTYETWKANN